MQTVKTSGRGGAARRETSIRIHRTKLAVPPRPPSFVERPRLDDILARAVEQPLTLISAHAGTGKTALLSSWAAKRRDVAWLTVDRDDNWSPHFWHAVELALDGVLARSDLGGDGVDDPVQRIIDRLPPRRSIVLVLDDLHEIENPVVLKELGSLISHAPKQLRLVVATRADPPLRIQRQRVAGQLAEVRARDLAFTTAECRDLLGPLADLLEDEDVESLCERTEGWAAGIRLAALSLEGEEDKRGFVHRFAGDERAVSDYLLNEIFDRLPKSRRRFMLRTAVPKRLTPELSVELSGDPHAARVLSELEAANFLISSQADKGATYRYHALLRDFLLARLAQLQPTELRLLQRRTADWAWRHGDPETAFRHAIAGEDWDLADELTAEAWNVVVFGVAARDRDAVSETPEAQLEGRPALALRVAAAHLFLGNRREAERIFQIGERGLESATQNRRDAMAVVSATFVLTLARLQGEYARVLELARELETQPIVGTFATAARERVRRAIVLSNLGTVDVATGDIADAEPRLYEAMSLARETGLDHVVLNSLSQLAMLESTRGRLRHAAELAREGVDFAERRNWETLHQGIGSRLVLGWAHYQWNELELASEQIEKAAAAARLWGDRTGTVGAALLDALVLAASGPDGSVDGLRRLRGVRAQMQGWRPPLFLAALVQTAEARVLAASGDLDGARLAIERSEVENGDGGLVLARISLAQGSPTDALAEIQAYAPASGTRDLAGQVEAGVLEAVAKQELNDRAGAAVAIESALGLAERGSYRRPFVDGGPSVRGLLVERVRHGTDHRALVAELIAALERRSASTELTLPELLEPLSDREQAVLRYLPTMMSNAEIASELFLSVNTVKTHLKSIYRKLGATRRRDAVERARRVELL